VKKKISILTLSFLFFVSTTGLPLVLHYCEMMEAVSFEVCEMHYVKPVQTGCCDTGSNADVFFTSEYDECCSTKLIDSSVKDDFVVSKTEITKIQLPVVLLIENNFNSGKTISDKFYTDTSPPLLADNHIYLSNSVLLI